MKKYMEHELRRIVFIALMVLLVAVSNLCFPAYAESTTTDVQGKIYEFADKSGYPISSADNYILTDSSATTYGRFMIAGEIMNTTQKSDVPAYQIKGNTLDFFYTYSDALLTTEKTSWHLYEDSSKTVDGKKLDEKISNGAIIVKTSKDQKTWVDVNCDVNAFEEVPVRTEPIYSASEVQILNGCFYQVTVVYKTRIKVAPTKVLFINIDNYEYKEHAEVYEFYVFSNTTDPDKTEIGTKYSLGKKARVEKYEGYVGAAEITKGDVHYGLEVGNFFVSGHTSTTKDDENNTVVLKNVGDTATLWFNMKADINALNGNKNLFISSDARWYDQFFETEKTNSGRGVLIIRSTDYENQKSKPTIYTNYLEANTTIGADTKVQLFEEGDYEVALDYEITHDKFIDQKSHYRIAFKFSVRNGNCMVYPFDIKTNEELTNSAMTENGFRIDMAKSRYLNISVKKEVLTDSADGLVEDTRINQVSRDGAEFTSEGIYTLTVSNMYTGQITTKKVYVGSNRIMRAYMTTGLSISTINDLVSQGANIDENGNITLAVNTGESSQETPSETPSVSKEVSVQAEESDYDVEDVSPIISTNLWLIYGIGGILIIIFVSGGLFLHKKKSRNSISIESNSDKGDHK